MMLDLMRAQADLDSFHLPKVVMTAVQTTRLTVDALQADAAIRAAAGH
jgi:hypothetical protein